MRQRQKFIHITMINTFPGLKVKKGSPIIKKAVFHMAQTSLNSKKIAVNHRLCLWL